MIDMYNHTAVQNHRMYNSKSELHSFNKCITLVGNAVNLETCICKGRDYLGILCTF